MSLASVRCGLNGKRRNSGLVSEESVAVSAMSYYIMMCRYMSAFIAGRSVLCYLRRNPA